jgi:hypothetical protein
MDRGMQIGTWARSGTFTGLVAAIAEDGTVTLFNPGDRQVLRADPGTVAGLPAGRVRVTVEVDLDIPHGLEEEALHRWVAALVDPILRDRARDALAEGGLDPSAFAPTATVEVREVPRIR